MSDPFETVIVDAGKSVEDALKALGWPASTHQKILDKSYNKKVKKAAAKPGDKVARKEKLLVPVVLPKQILEVEKRLSSQIAHMHELAKDRANLQKKLDALKKASEAKTRLEDKQFKALEAQVKRYRANAEKLLTSCVKAVKYCESIKYPHQILTKRYKDGMKKLDKTWKAVSARRLKDRKEIAELKKLIQALEVQEKLLAANLAAEMSRADRIKKLMP